jgi:hypothetical protein
VNSFNEKELIPNDLKVIASHSFQDIIV